MLSVCIISKNEEEVLETCLQSVAGIADEIILLDTGSTDNTIAIAQRYGCRIYHYDWDHNFAKARNTACSYARHEWILCLDCDERIRFPKRVLLAMQSAAPGTGCIIAERHNHAIAKDGERSNEMRGNARLFRNIPEIYWSFEVHEETWSSCISNGLALQHSDIIIDHEVWRPGANGYYEKQKYYEGLLNNCIARHKEQHYLFHSAKTRMLFEDYSKALAVFEQAENGTGYQVHNDAFLKCYKGYCYYKTQQPGLAEENLLQASALIPGLSAACFYLLMLYLRQGRYQEAYACAENLVLTESPSKPLTVADIYVSEVTLNYWKAYILLQTGETAQAKNMLLHTNYTCDSARSLALLGRIAFIEGNKKEALHWVGEALKCNPGWQYLQQLAHTFL